MSKANTEENTFRVLSRRPIAEADEIIFKKIMLGQASTQREFEDLCQSFGYTANEIREYQLNVKI